MECQRTLTKMALSWRRNNNHMKTTGISFTLGCFKYFLILVHIFLICVTVDSAEQNFFKIPKKGIKSSSFNKDTYSYEDVLLYLNASKESIEEERRATTQSTLEPLPPNTTLLKLSYMAAVPKIDKNFFQRLAMVSAVNSNEIGADVNILQEAECFQKDFEGGLISGAVNVAVNEINNNPNLLPGFHIQPMFENTCGSEKKSTRIFMEHWSQGAKVFIGPEMNCRVEAAMAAAQNIPILSYKCKDQHLSNKKKFPTFARTVPAETEITKAFMALMKHYQWHKFTVVYEGRPNTDELLQSIRNAIDEENERIGLEDSNENKYQIQNVTVMPYPFDQIQQNKKDRIRDTILETKDNTRIYIVFGDPYMFRQIVIEMGDTGLMQDGNYAAVYLDPDYNWLNAYHANTNHFFRDTMANLIESFAQNSTSRKMANFSKSVLAIIPTPVALQSEEYKNFWRENNQYLKLYGTHTNVQNMTIKPNRVACYLYDAVMLYASAATEYIKSANVSAEEAIGHGDKITRRILGKIYRSVQGFDMRINKNGDAEGNFTLLSLQPLEPYNDATSLDYYPLSAGLDVTADFIANGDASELPKLRFHRPVLWPSGSPPKDEPDCGFDGAKCRDEREYRIRLALYIAAGIFLFILVISAAWAYHRKTFEDKISNIWRIEEREIDKIVHTNTSANSLYLYDAGSRQSLLTPKDNNVTDKRFNSLRFVALYKNVAVAVKELNYNRKMKEPSRDTRIEMKAMVQLRHDNVNSFKGIILQPSQNKILVVREFCQKNSLLDMLKNKDIKLDHIFVTSFVEDLIKGMIYIHESEVRVHGNLKSSNCLITNRWALQVADFGLHELRNGVAAVSEEAKWESRLWMAPELLKTLDSNNPAKPTQKSDVYSFGVILHEIITRKGPYEVYSCTNGTTDEIKAIVDRILRPKETSDGYVVHRPDLKNTECQDYVKTTISMCWEEAPMVRPDFRHAIRQKLKPMSAGIHKRNIVDHMMLMMEKYQTDLENLVEERTAQLNREKCRTENLLQRMLPPSVAAQLMYGGEVKPQSFDLVTIYFSDIVGFTNISGSSTPMQVVSLLNNLYTLFDSVIKQYDVYKVETIGDAYMVVSGVPQFKDALTHGYEVCMMALHLLDASHAFKIPHMPEEKLRVRIGIHSGPCVAGVVGKTMPRYCLFGDAVNVASRMESNGLPHRIHISQNTANIISGLSEFHLEERGLVEVKGKGQMRTYWLSIASDRVFPQTDIDKLQMEQDKLEYFPSSIFADRAHDLKIRKAPAKPMTRGFTMDAEDISRLSLLNESQQVLNTEGGGILKRMFAKVTQHPEKYGPLPTQSQSFIPPTTTMAAEVKRALRTNRPPSPTRIRLGKVFESNEENIGLLNSSFEFDQLKSGNIRKSRAGKKRPETIDEDFLEQRKKTSQSTNDSLATAGSKSGSREIREVKDKPPRKRSSSAPEMDKMEPLWRQYESLQLYQQQNKMNGEPNQSFDLSLFDITSNNTPPLHPLYRSDELTPINENLSDDNSHTIKNCLDELKENKSSSSLHKVAKRKNALGYFPGFSGDIKALEQLHTANSHHSARSHDCSDEEREAMLSSTPRCYDDASEKSHALKKGNNVIEKGQLPKKTEPHRKLTIVDSVMPKNLPNMHLLANGTIYGEPTPDPPMILDLDDDEDFEMPLKKLSDGRNCPKNAYPQIRSYNYEDSASRYYDNDIDIENGNIHPLLSSGESSGFIEEGHNDNTRFPKLEYLSEDEPVIRNRRNSYSNCKSQHQDSLNNLTTANNTQKNPSKSVVSLTWNDVSPGSKITIKSKNKCDSDNKNKTTAFNANDRRQNNTNPPQKDISMEKLTRLLKKMDEDTAECKTNKTVPKRPPRQKAYKLAEFVVPPRPKKSNVVSKSYTMNINEVKEGKNMEKTPLTSSTDTNSSDDQNKPFIVDLTGV